VAEVMRGLQFPASQGLTFDYPIVLEGTTGCDADELKEAGMRFINMGQHAAALEKFEASLRCKQDPYVVSLAFMEACTAKNSAKARVYWPKLTSEQQKKFAIMCTRNGVDDYRDQDPALGTLNVFSKPNAEIMIDGRRMDLWTPIRGTQLQLPPGTHKVTFVLGGDRYTYPVELEAGKTLTLDKDLR
jgi:hypothetical protein